MRAAIALPIALSACAVAGEAPADLTAVDRLYEEALPHYEAAEAGSFEGQGGATIAYQAFRKPGATQALVIAPGRSEGSHTFMQFAYDLRDTPFDIFVIDHRGQGASSRLLPDPLLGHVEVFSDYVDDYAEFMRDVVQPGGYTRISGFGHSMGGAITVAYALEHPLALESIILSAPMLQIQTAPLGEDAMLWYARSVSPTETVPGFDWTEAPEFGGNVLTTDPEQFEALFETDNIFPERRTGRATYHWTAEAIAATQAMRARADELVSPVLLFQAGLDTVVVNAAQDEFCSAARSCARVEFQVAKHELLFAQAPVRQAIHAQLREFLNAE